MSDTSGENMGSFDKWVLRLFLALAAAGILGGVKFSGDMREQMAELKTEIRLGRENQAVTATADKTVVNSRLDDFFRQLAEKTVLIQKNADEIRALRERQLQCRCGDKGSHS